MRGVFMASLALLIGLVSQPVGAQPTVKLLPPENGVRLATTPIQLQLDRVPQGSLALELDAMDITALAQRQGNSLIATPPKALKPGKHTLRLTMETYEGELVELGRWSLKVQQNAVFDRIEGAWQGNMALSRRLGAEPRSGRDEWVADGAVSAQAKVEKGEWHAKASADIGYDSTAPTGDQAVLSHYLVSLQRKALSLSAGHQPMLGENLLSDGLTHRGVRFDINTPADLPVSARLFTSRPDDVSRFNHPFGVDDARNQISGGRLQFAPFSNHTTLVIETEGYEGRVTDMNTGWEQSGSGWTVALSDRLLHNRLTLRGELANSHWDADGRGSLVNTIDDRAWRLDAGYKWTSAAWQWLVQADYARIGPYFVSLLNPTQQTDQQGGRLGVAVAHDHWQGALSWQQIEDNVEHDTTQLTTRVEDWRAQVGYTFAQPFAHLLSGINLSLYDQVRTPRFIPTGYLGTPVDDHTQGLSLSTDLQFYGATGQLIWERSWQDDRRVSSNDADTQQLQLSLQKSWQISPGRTVSLAPGWVYGETDYYRSGQRVINETVSVDISSDGWMSGRMQVMLSPSWERNQDTLYTMDTDGYALSGSVNYRLRSAKQLPLTLSLTGNWQKQHDHQLNLTTETWQLYATLRLQWD